MDSDYSYTMYESSSNLSDASAAALGVAIMIFLAFYAAVLITSIVSLWRLFTKAGQPGWAAIVPIYNTVVMLQVSGRPVWWLLLMMFIPFFGIWVSIVAIIDFTRSYGKSVGFGVLVALLPFIGLPMLAFGKDTAYKGPIAEGLETFAPAPDKVATV